VPFIIARTLSSPSRLSGSSWCSRLFSLLGLLQNHNRYRYVHCCYRYPSDNNLILIITIASACHYFKQCTKRAFACIFTWRFEQEISANDELTDRWLGLKCFVNKEKCLMSNILSKCALCMILVDIYIQHYFWSWSPSSCSGVCAALNTSGPYNKI